MPAGEPLDAEEVVLYGEDICDGRPVQVRFLWTRLGPDSARWEQAFSFDDGPWEINWIMEFARARP